MRNDGCDLLQTSIETCRGEQVTPTYKFPRVARREIVEMSGAPQKVNLFSGRRDCVTRVIPDANLMSLHRPEYAWLNWWFP